MTQVFKTVSSWLDYKNQISGKTLGFVPTMGALHSGHISLMQRSLRENELTLTSIFVNPTQFNDPKDLTEYPRTLTEDLQLISSIGVPFLLAPDSRDLYADQYKYKVMENEESRILCGAHRPGHFDGVLTIVLKLLNIVQPTHIYLGEKDFQQLRLIEGMVSAFFIPTRVVRCPTVREEDGLAMSSRNQKLNSQQRKLAAIFPKILKEAPSILEAVSQLKSSGFEVDYVEDQYQRRLGAVRIGNVRLIDNV